MTASERQTEARPSRSGGAISRRSLVRLAIGVFAGLVVLGVASMLAQDVPGALDVLSDASVPWIGAAIAVQMLCYLLLGFQLARLFGADSKLGGRLAVSLAVLVYGLGTVVPGAPAPGMVIGANELARRGVEGSRIAWAFFLSTWFNVRSFLILAVLTAIAAILRGRVPNNSRGLVSAASAFVIAALILSAWLLRHPAFADRVGRLLEALNWRGSGPAARKTALRVHEAASGVFSSRRQGLLVAWATIGSRLADVFCLRFALIAVGIHVSLGVVLIAYVISTLVAAIPLLPGGLGLVEATVPGVLHYYGASVDAAVAGTIAWRGVTLLLPALAGVVVYASLRLRSAPVARPPRMTSP
ncbi:MAG: lysylphosphatidylglycerol synthase transmembrane domain-containing protein [Tepidiformaceae bacterium]